MIYRTYGGSLAVEVRKSCKIPLSRLKLGHREYLVHGSWITRSSLNFSGLMLFCSLQEFESI